MWKLVCDAVKTCDFCRKNVNTDKYFLYLGSGLICGGCLETVIGFYVRSRDEIEAAERSKENKGVDKKTDGTLLHLVRKVEHETKDGGN